MERIVYDELLHLTLNKIDSRQHGFLNNKSCSTNMILFVGSIISTLTKRTQLILFILILLRHSFNRSSPHPNTRTAASKRPSFNNRTTSNRHSILILGDSNTKHIKFLAGYGFTAVLIT